MKSPHRPLSASNPGMQVIPAFPGFSVLSPVFDPDKPEGLIDVSLDPILGWALDRDSLQPYPITLCGVDFDATPSVLKPDGSIDRLGLESYENIDQWKADLAHCYRGRNL
jgi:hypothetical protein